MESAVDETTDEPRDYHLLIGVRLASETRQDDRLQDASLGVIILKKSNRIPLSIVRREICTQLRAPPSSFSFLTSQGWQIKIEQESLIDLSQIVPSDGSYVCIKRSYGKPRIGLVTSEGQPIGFVFVDTAGYLSDLRNVINEQLDCLIDYSLLDRNGWPIAPSQEQHLLIFDLIKDCTIRVKLRGSHQMPGINDVNRGFAHMGDMRAQFRRAISTVAFGDNNPISNRIFNSRFPIPQLPFQCSVDADRPSNAVQTKVKPKQILISYVRAEAADHALRLKACLMRLGYAVYLDVHEIKSGVDWQDALNSAVSTCEVFVPLVTPRYGETQWTNREVKLADVLSKFILPICFLDHWPPKCLAIQFSTTQYIPWTPDDERVGAETQNDVESVINIRVWPEKHIHSVAKEITERMKTASKNPVDNNNMSHAQLSKKISTLRSYPTPLPDDLNQCSKHREGRPLIVVSLHPAQNDFGKRLSKILEVDGYEVWLSTKVLEENVAFPKELPTRNLGKSLTICIGQQIEANQGLETPYSRISKWCKILSDRLRRFQEKADEAGLILCVLSKEFADSKMTREQVFYCEHRKKMIPILFEDIQMPGWMSILIGTKCFEDARNSNFEDSVRSRIRRAFDVSPDEDNRPDELREERLSYEVQILKQKMAEPSEQVSNDISKSEAMSTDEEEYRGRTVCVYISGSVKFYRRNSEIICKSIGVHLARLDGVRVITGGFYGVGETVGKSYNETCLASGRCSSIWHILPIKDAQDHSRKGRQNPDQTFEPLSYGQTIFSGNSVRERESITSRAFDMCILIEGGPGAAYEAEQFTWNDHVVVPIKLTGGAAGGLFNVPEKIFEIPPGVAKEDWEALDNESLSPDLVGEAVAKIVCCIRDRLALDSPNFDVERESPYLNAGDVSFPVEELAPDKQPPMDANGDGNANEDDDNKSPTKKRVRFLPTEADTLQIIDSD